MIRWLVRCYLEMKVVVVFDSYKFYGSDIKRFVIIVMNMVCFVLDFLIRS